MRKRLYPSRRLLFTLLIFLAGFDTATSQNLELGAEYGRAYFFYHHKDYGTGLRKANASNYNFLAGFSLQKTFPSNFYWKTGLGFTMYQQYYSTRNHWGAFEEAYPVVLFPALVGYRTNQTLGFNINAGMLLCVMPDQYEGEFGALFLANGVIDSITRGSINRSHTPVFPLLNLNAGIRYSITPLWAAELSACFAKGFITITDYDIYYNDGNGKNDQRARQWGKGDFANLSLAIKYTLSTKGKKLATQRAS